MRAHQSRMAASLTAVSSQTRPLVSMIQLTLTLPGSLHSNPIWIVEPNGATRLQVIDAKERAGLALLGRAQTGEAPDVRRRIEELGKAALEVVIGGHTIEHCAVGYKWLW
jgi:hypothetical protein